MKTEAEGSNGTPSNLLQNVLEGTPGPWFLESGGSLSGFKGNKAKSFDLDVCNEVCILSCWVFARTLSEGEFGMNELEQYRRSLLLKSLTRPAASFIPSFFYSFLGPFVLVWLEPSSWRFAVSSGWWLLITKENGAPTDDGTLMMLDEG